MANRNMERAAKLLGQSKLAGRCLTPEQLAVACWPAAVGKKVAAHTRAAALVRGRLVVDVEDDIWRTQLVSLREQILRGIERVAGPGLVEEIQFRVMPARRYPAREQKPVRGAGDVEDPILKRIYEASVKKQQKRVSA